MVKLGLCGVSSIPKDGLCKMLVNDLIYCGFDYGILEAS
jgi:hypothetical protein